MRSVDQRVPEAARATGEEGPDLPAEHSVKRSVEERPTPQPAVQQTQSPPRAPGGRALTGRRLLAMIGVAVVFVAYQPGGESSLLNSLVLPLIGALCAWLITESVLVVALGVMLLAAAHTDRDAPGLVEPVLYPLLAVIAFVAVCGALFRRFRSAMEARRAQRWQARSASRAEVDSEVDPARRNRDGEPPRS